MNLLLLTEDDRTDGTPGGGGRFDVRGARAAHVAAVLRAEPGRELRVGLLEGPIGSGVVVATDSDHCELTCSFDGPPPPRARVDLVLAIPRAKSLKKVLPELSAMGVDRVVLLRTWRVAKPYLTQGILDAAEYRPLVHEGMMQGKTTREPRVSVEPLFLPFVEDRLPALVAGATALIAHPTADRSLATVPIQRADRVLIAVGPEGGFLPFEVDAFEHAGFRAVTISERTLRVETACVALLAQIDLLRRLSTQ